jgi:hypothetical protein
MKPLCSFSDGASGKIPPPDAVHILRGVVNLFRISEFKWTICNTFLPGIRSESFRHLFSFVDICPVGDVSLEQTTVHAATGSLLRFDCMTLILSK